VNQKKKQRKPIARRSKKQEELYEKRRPFVVSVLGARPFCEACPVFASHDGLVAYVRRNSTDVHEIIRRSQGGSILDENNVLAVCRECHNRIGSNPQLAFDLGLAKHGWERDK
jgi:5-methylcytosine-specific restriction endonuclease McrA